MPVGHLFLSQSMLMHTLCSVSPFGTSLFPGKLVCILMLIAIGYTSTVWKQIAQLLGSTYSCLLEGLWLTAGGHP